MAEYKKKKCKYLIAMGCLVQRYYEDLVKLLPEVDLFIKIDEYNKLWDKIEGVCRSLCSFLMYVLYHTKNHLW